MLWRQHVGRNRVMSALGIHIVCIVLSFSFTFTLCFYCLSDFQKDSVFRLFWQDNKVRYNVVINSKKAGPGQGQQKEEWSRKFTILAAFFLLRPNKCDFSLSVLHSLFNNIAVLTLRLQFRSAKIPKNSNF